MAKSTILVAAPRKRAWNEHEPGGEIALLSRGRLHPANPAYGMPAGEVCIVEGQGVKGDPGGQHTPWEVYPYPEVERAIRAGRLKQVGKNEDTSELQLGDDDLQGLDLNARAVAGLIERRVSGVEDLADKLASVADPIDWLTKTEGIGKVTANDLIEQLQARGLLEVV